MRQKGQIQKSICPDGKKRTKKGKILEEKKKNCTEPARNGKTGAKNHKLYIRKGNMVDLLTQINWI